MTYQIISSLNLEYKFQSIKIGNFENDYSLQNTPQNSMFLRLKYKNKFPIKNQILEVSLSGQYFLKRNDINPLLDYAIPPESYTMVNFNLGYHFKELKLPLSIEFSIQNLLNVAYRSYTDRLRYFADSKGIDFQLKTYLNF